MKKIVFLHIPKTGGTSVHNFLVQQFPKNKVCPARFNTLKKHTKSELDKYLYFSGHYDMEGVQHINGDKDVFTFFREPKDTVLSLYYFWRSHKSSAIQKHNLVGPRLAKSMSLLEFIRSKKGPLPGNINNYTTRVLIGKMYCGPNGEFSYPKDELLDRAKERIDSLKTFGVMNHYDESYKLVLSKLGFTAPDNIPHSRNSKNNVDPNIEPVTREEVTSEILEALADLTEFDQQIYEYAQQRYQQIKMK